MKKLTKTAAVVAAMSAMAIGTVVSVSADELKNTWNQENGAWYYYDNAGNKISNQWAIDSAGKWYFLGDDGKMVTNAFINDSVEIDNGNIPDGGNEEDPVYFVGSDGAMVTGWIQIDMNSLGGEVKPKTDKKYYYFGGSGYMFGDQWVASGDDWYYLNSNGQMQEKGFDESGDYYLTKGGKMATGWYKLTKDDADAIGNVRENDYIYANKDGELQRGWVRDNGKWYYIDDNFAMLDDTKTDIDGKTYYLKSGGAMATGYTKYDDHEYYYFNDSGEMQTKKFQKVGSRYYYFDNAGLSVSDLEVKDSAGVKVNYFYVEETTKRNTTGTKELVTNATGASAVSSSAISASIVSDDINTIAEYYKDNGTSGSTYKIYKLGSSTTKTVKVK